MAHLGSLMAVIICMLPKLKPMIKNPFCKTNIDLMISTIPAVIIVLLFKGLVDKLYGMQFVLYGFLLTGILLMIADMCKTKNRQITHKIALLMGIVQSIAILPGISRSGSTMSAGMLAGVDKEKSCEYSFLMSIPIIIGSAVYEMIGLVGESVEIQLLPLFVAFLSSFLFAILSIKLMLKIVKTNKLFIFGIYALALSTILFFVML